MINFESVAVQRTVALLCATVHYGMANLSTRNAPADYRTVLRTADSFNKYLISGTVPSMGERR